ncbi:MAG: prepilin-type N-terminal cleavage/methylation domain-containing protein [Isosphaeraceae bacterium]
MRGPLRDGTRRGGFTLVELLVVILLILLVSAATLPTVISAYSHREVSEAARILQAGLVGARDLAISTNAPAGIRLLPDPDFIRVDPATGQVDPRQILAANRFVPIQLAPDYSEGAVSIYPMADPGNVPYSEFFPPAYPKAFGGGNFVALMPAYPLYEKSGVLVLEQAVRNRQGMFNSPTSWYWNVRLGDRIQINNTGPYYTIVGPMVAGPEAGNSEYFVNVGPPGTESPMFRTILVNGNTISTRPEFLLLVNGLDDNKDGFVDNGWDGVDNNGVNGFDELAEWIEFETWGAAFSGGAVSVPYTITRRPVVAPGARETTLPGSVLVDLTYAPATVNVPTILERSRLPVNPVTGIVDILLDPNGQVVPSTTYSSPSSFGMDSAFYHFWLAERSDLHAMVIDPSTGNTVPLLNGYPFRLPMPYGAADATNNLPNAYDTLVAANPTLPVLKGEIRILTLFTRTGQLITTEAPPFDVRNTSQPFLQPQQGVRGGQ